MKRTFGIFLAAVAMMCVLSSGSAEGAFKIRLSDGSSTVTITDQGTGDVNAAVGGITYIDSSSFAGWTLTVTTGQSKPITGDPFTAVVTTSLTFTYVGGGTGTLTVDLTDTDFVLPPYPSAVVTNSAQTNAGSLLYTSYVQSGVGGNTEFGGIDNNTGTIITNVTGPVTGGPVVTSVGGPISNPFSISTQSVLTMSGPASGSIDVRTTVVVPAPAGVVLALTAVPFLGLGYIRRRKAAVKA